MTVITSKPFWIVTQPRISLVFCTPTITSSKAKSCVWNKNILWWLPLFRYDNLYLLTFFLSSSPSRLIVGYYPALQVVQVWLTRSRTHILWFVPRQSSYSAERHSSVTCYSGIDENPYGYWGTYMGQGIHLEYLLQFILPISSNCSW